MKPSTAFSKLAYAPATVVSLTVLVATATAAIAEFKPVDHSAPSPEHVIPLVARYIPPDDAGVPHRVSSGTTRGRLCSASSPDALVPLSPQTHVGQTTSLQPTLVWYTPDVAAATIQVLLYEQIAGGELEQIDEALVDITERAPSGITTLSLRNEGISLAPNTIYTWQVILDCDSGEKSEIQGDIAVVEAPSALAESLPTATSTAERVSLYAEKGLWYDALGEAVAAEANVAKDIQRSLLRNLVELEAGRAPDFSDRLNHVIDGIR